MDFYAYYWYGKQPGKCFSGPSTSSNSRLSGYHCHIRTYIVGCSLFFLALLKLFLGRYTSANIRSKPCVIRRRAFFNLVKLSENDHVDAKSVNSTTAFMNKKYLRRKIYNLVRTFLVYLWDLETIIKFITVIYLSVYYYNCFQFSITKIA